MNKTSPVFRFLNNSKSVSSKDEVIMRSATASTVKPGAGSMHVIHVDKVLSLIARRANLVEFPAPISTYCAGRSKDSMQ